MCFIIDANVLPEFFSHPEFVPAFKWISQGAGKVIVGGTKYRRELEKCEAAFDLVIELGRMGKTRPLPDNLVDEKQTEIEKRNDLASDDPHIVAMVVMSKCRIVCTRDKGLIAEFKKQFRERFGVTRPRAYNRAAHQTLLNANNVVGFCR